MVNKNTANSRIVTLDLLKGMLIIAIVFIHLVTNTVSFDKGYQANLITQALQSQFMLFFIISGYFFRPDKSYWTYMKSRSLKFAFEISICILILPLIMYAYLFAVGQPQPFSDYTSNVLLYLVGYKTFDPIGQVSTEWFPMMIIQGYYYLQLMASAFVIFYAIAKPAMKNNTRFVITLFLLVSATCFMCELYRAHLPYEFQIAPLAAGFMLVGAYCGEKKVVERMEAGKWVNRKIVAMSAALFVILVILVIAFPPGTNFYLSSFGSYGGYSAYPFFIMTIIVCYFVLIFGVLLSKTGKFANMLCIVGAQTYTILLFQEFLIKIIVAPFCELPHTSVFPDLSLAAIVIVGILTIFFGMLIGKYGGIVKKRIKGRVNFP